MAFIAYSHCLDLEKELEIDSKDDGGYTIDSGPASPNLTELKKLYNNRQQSAESNESVENLDDQDDDSDDQQVEEYKQEFFSNPEQHYSCVPSHLTSHVTKLTIL